MSHLPQAPRPPFSASKTAAIAAIIAASALAIFIGGVVFISALSTPTAKTTPASHTSPAVTVTVTQTAPVNQTSPAAVALTSAPASTTIAKASAKTVTAPTTAPVKKATTASQNVYYSSCAQAKAAGAAPIHRGHAGYRSGLDRDKDGIACE